MSSAPSAGAGKALQGAAYEEVWRRKAAELEAFEAEQMRAMEKQWSRASDRSLLPMERRRKEQERDRILRELKEQTADRDRAVEELTHVGAHAAPAAAAADPMPNHASRYPAPALRAVYNAESVSTTTASSDSDDASPQRDPAASPLSESEDDQEHTASRPNEGESAAPSARGEAEVGHVKESASVSATLSSPRAFESHEVEAEAVDSAPWAQEQALGQPTDVTTDASTPAPAQLPEPDHGADTWDIERKDTAGGAGGAEGPARADEEGVNHSAAGRAGGGSEAEELASQSPPVAEEADALGYGGDVHGEAPLSPEEGVVGPDRSAPAAQLSHATEATSEPSAQAPASREQGPAPSPPDQHTSHNEPTAKAPASPHKDGSGSAASSPAKQLPHAMAAAEERQAWKAERRRAREEEERRVKLAVRARRRRERLLEDARHRNEHRAEMAREHAEAVATADAKRQQEVDVQFEWQAMEELRRSERERRAREMLQSLLAAVAESAGVGGGSHGATSGAERARLEAEVERYAAEAGASAERTAADLLRRSMGTVVTEDGSGGGSGGGGGGGGGQAPGAGTIPDARELARERALEGERMWQRQRAAELEAESEAAVVGYHRIRRRSDLARDRAFRGNIDAIQGPALRAPLAARQAAHRGREAGGGQRGAPSSQLRVPPAGRQSGSDRSLPYGQAPPELPSVRASASAPGAWWGSGAETGAHANSRGSRNRRRRRPHAQSSDALHSGRERDQRRSYAAGRSAASGGAVRGRGSRSVSASTLPPLVTGGRRGRGRGGTLALRAGGGGAAAGGASGAEGPGSSMGGTQGSLHPLTMTEGSVQGNTLADLRKRIDAAAQRAIDEDEAEERRLAARTAKLARRQKELDARLTRERRKATEEAEELVKARGLTLASQAETQRAQLREQRLARAQRRPGGVPDEPEPHGREEARGARPGHAQRPGPGLTSPQDKAVALYEGEGGGEDAVPGQRARGRHRRGRRRQREGRSGGRRG